MKGFRIQLNGDETVTAGLSGRDVFSVVATSVVRDKRYRPADEPSIDLRLHVGGLRRTAEGTQGTVEWLDRELRLGDKVTIRVVDVGEADIAPPSRERTMAEVTESGERYQLAYLLKKYGVP
jgi:hypothetical protein